MKLRFHIAPAVLLACVFAQGCGAPFDAREFTGVNAQAIGGGTPIDPTALGIVEYVDPLGACSGTLVRNNWVLSAAHCWAGGWDQIAGKTVTLQGQTSNVIAAYPHTDSGVNDTLDAMLVKLATPIAMSGSVTGWKRDLTSASALPADAQLTCYGYGDTNTGVTTYPELTYTNDEYKIEDNGDYMMSLGANGVSHFFPGVSTKPGEDQTATRTSGIRIRTWGCRPRRITTGWSSSTAW